jgi:hypothetical protein
MTPKHAVHGKGSMYYEGLVKVDGANINWFLSDVDKISLGLSSLHNYLQYVSAVYKTLSLWNFIMAARMD